MNILIIIKIIIIVVIIYNFIIIILITFSHATFLNVWREKTFILIAKRAVLWQSLKHYSCTLLMNVLVFPHRSVCVRCRLHNKRRTHVVNLIAFINLQSKLCAIKFVNAFHVYGSPNLCSHLLLQYKSNYLCFFRSLSFFPCRVACGEVSCFTVQNANIIEKKCLSPGWQAGFARINAILSRSKRIDFGLPPAVRKRWPTKVK